MDGNNGGNAKTRAADQDAAASWSKANKKKKLKKKRTRSEPRHSPPDTNGGRWQDKQSRYPKGTIARPPEERLNPKSATSTIKPKKRPEPARTLRRRPVKDPDPPKRHPKPTNADEEKMRAIKKAKNVEDVKRMLLDKEMPSQKRTMPRTNKSRVSPSPPSSPDPPVDQKESKPNNPTKSDGKSLLKDLFKSKDKSKTKDPPQEKTQSIPEPQKPPSSKEAPLSRESPNTKEPEKSSESIKPSDTSHAPNQPGRTSSDVAKSPQKPKEPSGTTGSGNRGHPNTPKDVSISLDPSDTSLLPKAFNKKSNAAATNENRALLDSISSTPKLNDETLRALETLAANLTENNRLDEGTSQQVYDLEIERNRTEQQLDKLLQRYEQIEKSIKEKTGKITEDIELIEREVHNLKQQEKLLTDSSGDALERIGSIEDKEKDRINEIDELKGKLGENTDRISDSERKLQDELDNFMSNNMTALSAALEDNDKTMNELKGSIATLKTEQTEIDNKLKRISDADEQLENTLELMDESLQTLRSNQDETNDQMQEMTNTNEKLTADVRDLKRDSETFKSEMADSVAFREDMNEFKSKTAEDIDGLVTELSNEKGEMDDMKQNIDDITGKQREYGRESDGIQQKLSQLQQKHSDIEDEIKSIKRRSTNVQTENKVGSQAANDIRNDLYAQAEKIERLQDGINEIELSLINIKGAQEEASSSLSKLDDDHETAMQDMMNTIAKTDSELENIKGQLQTQLNNHGIQTEELRKDITNINQELEHLSKASDSIMDDLSNKVNSVKSKQEEYSRTSRSYATKDSMARVNDKVEKMVDEVASNARNLANKDEVQNEKLDQISNKLASLDQLTADVARTESDLQSTGNMLEEYQSSMASLSGQVADQAEQLENLHAAFEDRAVSANEPGDGSSSPSLAELERRMEQLTDEVADLHSRSGNELESSVNERLLELQDNIKTLNYSITETKEYVESINTGTDNEGENAEQWTEVREQLSNHNQEIDEIKLRLADTQSTIANIGNRNSKPTAAQEDNTGETITSSVPNEVLSDVQNMKTEISSYEDRFTELEDALGVLQANREETAKELEKLDGIALLGDRINKMNETVDDSIAESRGDKMILSEKLGEIEEMINVVNASVTENRIESSQLRALVTNLTDDHARVIDRLHTIENEEGNRNDTATRADIDDTVESILESKLEHLKKELTPATNVANGIEATVSKSHEVLSKSEIQEIVSVMLNDRVRDTPDTPYDNSMQSDTNASSSNSELNDIKEKLQILRDDFSDTTDSVRDELSDLREQIVQSNSTDRLPDGGDSTSENKMGNAAQSVRDELAELHNQFDELNSTLHESLSRKLDISAHTTAEIGGDNIAEGQDSADDLLAMRGDIVSLGTNLTDVEIRFNDFEERLSVLEEKRTADTDAPAGVNEAVSEAPVTEGNVSDSSGSDIRALRQDISELQAIYDELEAVTSDNMTEFRQELMEIERIVADLEAGGTGNGGTDAEEIKELGNKVQTLQDQLMNMNKGFRQVFEDIFARDNDQEQRIKRIQDIQQYQFRMMRTMEMKIEGQG